MKIARVARALSIVVATFVLSGFVAVPAAHADTVTECVAIVSTQTQLAFKDADTAADGEGEIARLLADRYTIDYNKYCPANITPDRLMLVLEQSRADAIAIGNKAVGGCTTSPNARTCAIIDGVGKVAAACATGAVQAAVAGGIVAALLAKAVPPAAIVEGIKGCIIGGAVPAFNLVAQTKVKDLPPAQQCAVYGITGAVAAALGAVIEKKPPASVVVPEFISACAAAEFERVNEGQNECLTKVGGAIAGAAASADLAGTPFVEAIKDAAFKTLITALQEGCYQTKTNTAVIIDTSGSMDDSIASVRQAAKDLAASLTRTAGNKVALVTFNDPGCGVEVDLTGNVGAFNGAVDGLIADGGDDIPEAGLCGLHAAVTGLSWEAEADKSFIVITDAAYKDPDPNGYTAASVLAEVAALRSGTGTATAARTGGAQRAVTAAAEVDSYVPINVVPVGGGSAVTAQWKALADTTGGAVYSADTGDAVGAALLSALDAFLPPEPRWDATPTWYGGTGTMAGVRKAVSGGYDPGACTVGKSEYGFVFRVPANLDPAKLRWWAVDVATDTALTRAYGKTLTATNYARGPHEVVLCLPDRDGGLPTGLDNVEKQIRLSW